MQAVARPHILMAVISKHEPLIAVIDIIIDISNNIFYNIYFIISIS
jgi:hypothetical protein